jgi:hypothetical protein
MSKDIQYIAAFNVQDNLFKADTPFGFKLCIFPVAPFVVIQTPIYSDGGNPSGRKCRVEDKNWRRSSAMQILFQVAIEILI